jgi:CPA2 family monovalent cation:H+ antiporter-2
MPHDAPLIATIVAGFVLAFAFGAVANRLRISPLVGYLVAGVAIGPYTPGFHADQGLTLQLAEIGVILLMFGVGLHFSVKDLLSVKAIAVPGAIAQIAIATLMGMGLAWMLGWPLGGGLVFGLALSVASTVVLLRALEGHHLVETERGRIAVGWLVVEDLAMVLTLVLLPAVADLLGGGAGAGPSGDVQAPGALAIASAIALTIGKVIAFVAVMLLVGRRVIPWLLHHIAHTGSRELFRLAVLAIALGVAYAAAQLFDVSLALGAFFAGMVLSESELSHQAASETLPLRDAFAVLFFVSVGMVFDPLIVVREPWSLLATLFIIVLGKSLASFAIVRAFGHGTGTALTVSASLAQIGEFSFILAGLGVTLGLMPEAGRGLILGGAILSIFLNPLVFELAERLRPRFEPREAAAPAEAPAVPDILPPVDLSDHAVIVGYGRVGSLVGEALAEAGRPFVVIEERDGIVASLRQAGVPAIAGNAAAEEVIRTANLPRARWLVVAIPNAFEAGQIVEQARTANPHLDILARAHFDAEVEHLRSLGANTIIMGEREIARAMIAHILRTQAIVPPQ